jgi:hypothetical protein
VPLIAYIQYGPVTSIKVAHCTMTGCPYTGPVLTVADAAVVEGDAGTVDAVLRFTLSEPSPDYISGYFDTWIDFGATATPVTDFDRVFPTVQFAPGEVAKTAVIPIVGDTTVEPTSSSLPACATGAGPRSGPRSRG